MTTPAIRSSVDDRDPRRRRAASRRCSSASGVSGPRPRHAAAHDPLHRRVREPVGDRPVEILAADDADERARPSATRIPLWPWRWQSDERRGDRLVRADACGPGVDMIVARADGLAHAPRAAPRRRARARASASGPRKIADAACACPPPPSAAATRRRVELGRPAARDAEDAAVHLDEQHERPRVGEVDDLVREVRDPVDVARPRDRGDEHARRRPASRVSRRSSERGRAAPARRRRAACAGTSSTSSWRAPWRRHQASASASRWVAVG